MRLVRLSPGLVASLLLLHTHVAEATVTSYTIHTRRYGGAIPSVAGGVTGIITVQDLILATPNSLVGVTVRGSSLDLSTGAEVVDQNGRRVGTSSTGWISNRQGGANTHIDVSLEGMTGTAGSYYRILIHYAVEVNGPDVITLHLLASGSITSMSVDGMSTNPLRPFLEAGVPYTFRYTGTAMDVAAVDLQRLSTTATIISRSSTLLVFQVAFPQPGFIQLSTFDVYDERLGRTRANSDYERYAYGYDNQASPNSPLLDDLYLKAVRRPVVTSVSPQPSNSTGTIRLNGSNLSGGGLGLYVMHMHHRYSNTVSDEYTSPHGTATATATSITFTARDDMANGPLELEFMPVDRLAVTQSQAARDSFAVRLSVPFTSVGTPAIRKVQPANEQAARSGVRIVRAGSMAIAGRYLFVESPGMTFLQSNRSGTVATPPVVSLGNATGSVTSTRYTITEDTVNVVFADPPDNVTGQLVLRTSAGADSSAEPFLLVTAPHVASLVEISDPTTALRVLVTPTSLERGKLYQISGTALSLVTGTQQLQIGSVQLNGRPLVLLPTSAPNTLLRFAVPADAQSGPLVVSTDGGATTVGTFTVTNPTTTVVTPRPTAISTTQASAPAGTSLVGTVQLDNAGSTVAGFSVALTSSDSTVARVMPSVSTTGLSATFSIQTRTVAASRAVTISATSGGVTKTLSLTVTPAVPASLTVDKNDVVAGATVIGRLSFTGAPAENTIITLTTSDPALVVAPTVNASGVLTTFTMSTTEAPAPRTVTLTATANGVTQSTTVTVTPLVIASVETGPKVTTSNSGTRTVLRMGTDGTLTITLNRAPAVATTFTVASSNPSLLQFTQATISVPAGQSTGSIGLHVTAAPAADTPVTLTLSRTVVTTAFGTVTVTKTSGVNVSP